MRQQASFAGHYFERIMDSTKYQAMNQILKGLQSFSGIDPQMSPEEAKRKLSQLLNGISDAGVQDQIAKISGDLSKKILQQVSQGLKDGGPLLVTAVNNLVSAIPVVGAFFAIPNAALNGMKSLDVIKKTLMDLDITKEEYLAKYQTLSDTIKNAANKVDNKLAEGIDGVKNKATTMVDNAQKQMMESVPTIPTIPTIPTPTIPTPTIPTPNLNTTITPKIQPIKGGKINKIKKNKNTERTKTLRRIHQSVAKFFRHHKTMKRK
jgi:hypothetical protein